MWSRIRSLFRRDAALGTPDGFASIRRDVEAVLRLDLASDAAREANGEFVFDVLRRMDAETDRVRRQANGYPANPIAADVWMDGAGYGNLAQALTAHFAKAGWLKREENASLLWVKATLAVCSHYHHMVGPAMLANADCRDRLGDAETATGMYGGVVKDFAFFADEWEGEAGPPDDESRIALESLRAAAERLVARGVGDLDGIDLPSLLSRTSAILARPTANPASDFDQ